MKRFDKAILKLTAIYTVILFVISIGFSFAVYNVTMAEMNRPLPARSVVHIVGDGEVEEIIIQRNHQVGENLIMQLVVINACVLAAGAVVSYCLAKFTLKPIRENVERQIRFVSDASHELRTPLAIMQMENEVILRDKSAKCSDYKAQVESNLEEVGKVSALADRLLKLSKSEKLSLGDVDVLKVVNEAIEKFSKTPKFKNIEIKNKVRSKKITANADALEQILVILIDNAIKYSPKKSVVTISNGDGKIAVSDQGPGIAVEDLPYIFDRFYRAEKSRTTDGYGLGLSLAQHLAARQNLRIAVENIKKGGAKFTIL